MRVHPEADREAGTDPLKLRMNMRLGQLHWTLVEVADRTGESYRNVHRWMREDVKIPAHFIARFVEVVPVNATWLLSGTGSPHPVEQSSAEAALERIAAVLASVRVSTSGGVLAEQVVQGCGDGIMAVDRECRVTLWNPAMTRIAGVDASAVLGHHAFEVVPFLDSIGEREFFLAALRGESAIAADRRVEVPGGGPGGWYEGHYAPLRDPQGEIVGGVAVIRDVTGWKDDLDRLRESEERYMRLLEMSPDPVLVEAEGAIIYANRALAELLATEAAALAGLPLDEILLPAEPRSGSPGGEGRGSEGSSTRRLLRRDGSQVHVEISSVEVEIHGRPGTQAVFRSLAPV